MLEEEKRKRHKEANLRWRKKNLEHAREMSNKWKRDNKKRIKEYYLKNREKFISSASEWRKKNLEKYKASRLKHERTNLNFRFKKKIRNQARRKINIPINQICERCNKNKATDRHHEDYSKPLEVYFCCANCHKILDRERRIL